MHQFLKCHCLVTTNMKHSFADEIFDFTPPPPNHWSSHKSRCYPHHHGCHPPPLTYPTPPRARRCWQRSPMAFLAKSPVLSFLTQFARYWPARVLHATKFPRAILSDEYCWQRHVVVAVSSLFLVRIRKWVNTPTNLKLKVQKRADKCERVFYPVVQKRQSLQCVVEASTNFMRSQWIQLRFQWSYWFRN